MMDAVKKNIISIVCGVVALVAVVAIFYPMGGYFEELDEKVAKSATDYSQMKSLASSTFTKPQIDPTSTEAAPLEVFPTQPVIDAGKKAVEQMATRSQEMLDKAMEMNRRRPLVADALPYPQTGSALSDFKILYYAKKAEWTKAMNATPPPQRSEIAAAEKEIYEKDFASRIQVVNGQEKNKALVDAAFLVRKATLPDEMRWERSQQFSVYVTEVPGVKTQRVFDENRGIPPQEKPELPPLADVWAAQLSIWIQDDIVRSIVDTNNKFGEKNARGIVPVRDAPVKRLVRIDVDKRYVTRGKKVPITISRLPRAGMMPQQPGTVDEISGAASLTKFYGDSMTGRICNTLYDVVHFTVVVDVEARRMRQFMQTLTANKFFTVLEMSWVGVDREFLASRGFVYSDEPVTQLTLKCEAIFFRNWTAEWMPDGIKKILNIPLTPAGPVAGVR